MSQLCIHTQLPSNFCTFKYWKKSIQYTSKCTGIWIKTQPWLKHHIHDEDHPQGTHYTRYNSCMYRKPYNSLYLYWNELNDWTLVWINQIWWFHSSMTCRQVLWSASLSLNVWDSQRDTSIIDFSEWWGMDWLGPRCFGGDPYE